MVEMERFLINDLVMFSTERKALISLDDTGNTVSLNGPASECLTLLLNKNGKVIDQKEFFYEVWESKGQYVTTNTFYQNISVLRKAMKAVGINDDIIKTLPKLGIKFTGKVEMISAEHKLYNLSENSQGNIENSKKIEMTVSHNNKINTIGLIALPFISILILALTIIDNIKHQENYLSLYGSIGEVNQCLVKAKGPDTTSYKSELISLFNHSGLICNKGQTAYITPNSLKNKGSVILCDPENNLESCITYSFTENHYE